MSPKIEIGLKTVIVMPDNAPATKRAATAGYGAEVIIYDPTKADRKQIAALAAEQDRLKQQVVASQDLAGGIKTLQEQQANLQSSIGRLNSTMNSLASTQSAQEARIKDNEQWVQSNIEFRKQVTQRLTRLENPPSALPAP